MSDEVRDYDFLFKILLVGDSGTGKSCVLHRFTDNTYAEDYVTTIGVDFKIRTLQVEQHVVKLQIWDTAGHERFQALTRTYYRGGHGIFVVTDMTNLASLVNTAKYWLPTIDRESDEDPVLIMLVNKCDLRSQAQITEQHLSGLTIPYFKTSAKTGVNVTEAFEEMARQIMKRRRDRLGQMTHRKTHGKEYIYLGGPQVGVSNKDEQEDGGCCVII